MNLFWDKQNHELVGGLNDQATVDPLVLVLRDTVAVSLAVVTPQTSGDAYVAGELDAGESIAFGIKTSAPFSGGYLVYCDSWTLTGSGTTARYNGTINLNTQELIDALTSGAATDEYLEVTGEFTIVTSEGYHKETTQFKVEVVDEQVIVFVSFYFCAK